VEATEPTTMEAAAESLLAPEEAPEQEQEETEAEAVEAPQENETETDEAEDTAEVEDADEDEAEAGDAEQDEDDEETDADQEDQSDRITVKVDGEEVAVTLDDLKRSFSGQAYIQKGMKEAAEAKKAVEEQQQTLQAERNALVQLAQQLQQGGLTPPTPPDEAMIQQDPVGYMQAQAEYQREMQSFQAKQGQLQQLTQQQQAAEADARQAFLAEQAEALKQAIPDFADADKAREVKGAIVKTARDVYGFSEDELNNIVDARHVRVLDDARRYRELMASKDKVSEKAKKARPPLRPGAKKPRTSAQQQREKQRQKLKQTGRLDDAVSLIMETDSKD